MSTISKIHRPPAAGRCGPRRCGTIPTDATDRRHFLRGVRMAEKLMDADPSDTFVLDALMFGVEHDNAVFRVLGEARKLGPQVEAGFCAVLTDVLTGANKCPDYVELARDSFAVQDGKRRPYTDECAEGGAA